MALQKTFIIIGTGFSGLALAIRLKQSGFDDFVLLERASEVGGTWRDNTYPGCACDIESNVYSFSFAPNPNWSHTYSPQKEILDYLKSCVREFDLARHIQFDTDVKEADWNSEDCVWRLKTSRGDWLGQYVAAGIGPLSDPFIPKFEGQEKFQGKQFHSSRWDSSYDFSGKRVAVIGTGASTIQFLPTLQKSAREVFLFQRTPAWVIPRPNRRISKIEKKIFQKFPSLQRAARALTFRFREFFVFGFRRPWVLKFLEFFIRWNVAQQIQDQDLRRKLTPQYRLGCKRVLLSDDYWPTLKKPNVHLVTEPIQSFSLDSVTTTENSYGVDAIVYGSGFRVTDSPFYERIRNGEGRSLADVWQGSPQAYLGIFAHGFPNLFFLLGPNTGLGHNSVVAMVEAQAEYIVKFFTYARQAHIRAIEAKPEAQSDYVERLSEEIRHTVWSTGGCLSWYLDRTGRNSTLWPHSATAYAKRLKAFEPDRYNLTT